ncbi:hypothetical protein CK203_060254 [Vitis vinifera]|uniref:Uncharacterized protein n=1 Tax=Vitis vinifera TaxID=29760 RepID=A0A438GLN5_VITVI|nr:hypothetical protein CK203_060254 [Vitis vinifera]
MIMRNLQPKFARHLMGFPHTDFGFLVQALFAIKEGITRAGMRPLRGYPTVGQTSGFYYLPSPYVQETSCPIHSASSPVDHYLCAKTITSVCSIGYAFESSFSKLKEGELLTPLAPKLPSVTTNPLPTHSTYAMSPPPGDIHHIDLIKDDSIHRLSWDDRLPEPIVLHDSSELVGATCIVFSDDDLPPEGLDHICPLYITVGCSGHKVPSILLDYGSALNVCPLTIATTLGHST